MHFTDQRDYRVRFETGEQGLLALLHGAVSHVVIIDVLSFSTCVDIAVARGAEIIPYRWRDSSAQDFARERAALLAGGPGSPYSLVAESLISVPSGTRLGVLPPKTTVVIERECVVLTGRQLSRTARQTPPTKGWLL